MVLKFLNQIACIQFQKKCYSMYTNSHLTEQDAYAEHQPPALIAPVLQVIRVDLLQLLLRRHQAPPGRGHGGSEGAQLAAHVEEDEAEGDEGEGAVAAGEALTALEDGVLIASALKRELEVVGCNDVSNYPFMF